MSASAPEPDEIELEPPPEGCVIVGCDTCGSGLIVPADVAGDVRIEHHDDGSHTQSYGNVWEVSL